MVPPFAQPKRQSVMQYSVRGIMLATLAVGIVCAVAMPLLKVLDLSAWALGWTFGWALAGAICSVAFRCIMRYKVEQKCGALLFTIPSVTRRGRRWAIGGGIVGGISMIAVDLWTASTSPYQAPLSIQAFMGGTFLAGAFLAIWWKGIIHSCELCEHGVVAGSISLMPWTSFCGYRRAYDNSLQVLLKHNFFTLRVPPDQEQQVLEIFDTHIPGKTTA
jgi:hypothetical protein